MKNVVQLAKDYLRLKLLLAEVRGQESEVNRELAEAEAALRDAMGLQGVPRIVVDGRTLYLTTYVSAKLAPDVDRELVAGKLEDAGLGDFLKKRFNLSELSSYFRQIVTSQKLVNASQAIPPELQNNGHTGAPTNGPTGQRINLILKYPKFRPRISRSDNFSGHI